jgi:hypothetical protein
MVAIESPIEFILSHGGRASYGYEATILADICPAWTSHEPGYHGSAETLDILGNTGHKKRQS